MIVDEFHHAAAPSYDRLLQRLAPTELLGLTATPERADGMPILHWFGDRIAAELRLWDAIDQQRLAPFHYYGLHDGLDLRDVGWRRGRGYDIAELSNLVTGDAVLARRVIGQVADHVPDTGSMRALGFCVSVDHARFMAQQFRNAGIAAAAVTGQTPDQERRDALRQLADGDLQAVFSVDLFNEGVDVPDVDTVIMLRPTDSATVFVQQLGRGLRKAPGKSVCTVLDFVGHHRAEFRYDTRFAALLGGTRKELEQKVREDFPYLPTGCHLTLDPVAKDIVLASIRNALPSRWPQLVAELAAMATDGHEPTLANYLHHTGLALDDVYSNNRSWSDLLQAAGLPVAPAGPEEVSLRRAIGRQRHIDDLERISTFRHFLVQPVPPRPDSPREAALLRMLVVALAGRHLQDADLAEAADLLWRHPQVRAEYLELLDLLERRPDHLQPGVAGPTGRPAAHPRQLHPRGDPGRAAPEGLPREDPAMAGRRLLGRRPAGRRLRRHHRQERRPLLPHHAVPRLRHQPRPLPLGEPIDDGRRVPDRTPLPQPRVTGLRHPAVRPADQPRAVVLVPRAGDLRGA